VLCLVAITTIGLGATEISWLHAFGVAGESMSHGG
jgi:glucosamine 6-phosphate synthetase-like amidotransferase/phosphosugar isomerase protein